MNEPIINPWIFYWLDVLHSLRGVLILSFVPIIVCFIFGGIAYLEAKDLYENYNDVDCEKRLNIATKRLTGIIIWSVVTIMMLIFTPSRETAVKMLISQHITQHNVNIAGETVEKLIDKAVEKIIAIKKEK